MKNGKSLLIPFIVMVILFIGVIVYFAFSGKGKTDESQEASTVNALYIGLSEVKSISVTSSDPSFPEVRIDVINNSDGTQSYSYNGSDSDPEENYSDIKMTSYLSALTDYSSAFLVAENANMSEYGLDNPKYTVIIDTLNGTSSKISFGNISFSGEYCYIRIDGGSTVYSVPVMKYDYVTQRAINFIDTSVLNIDALSLAEVEFIRKTDDLDLVATCSVTDNGVLTYDFYEPFSFESSSYFDSLIAKICNLEITEFIEPEDADLTNYKLDDPEFRFILTQIDGTKTEVCLSENIGGYYYGYIKDSDYYFSINDVQLQGLEMASVQYLEDYVSYYQASEITTLKGTYDGKTFELKIKTDSEGSISGEDSDVSLDGRNAKVFNSDGRSYCAILFESFACMEIGGIDLDAVVDTSAAPVMVLEYTTVQYENHKIEFYTRSDNSYYVVKDGEYLKVFVYAKELFNDGGSDTYNYGVWAAYELLKTSIDENMNGVYDITDTNAEAA